MFGFAEALTMLEKGVRVQRVGWRKTTHLVVTNGVLCFASKHARAKAQYALSADSIFAKDWRVYEEN